MSPRVVVCNSTQCDLFIRDHEAAQNEMDTGIPVVGKRAETHRAKVLKRYRSIVDAWLTS